MSNRYLLRKSPFMSRRKIIIYVIMSFFILGIVAGFTNTFNSDNRRLGGTWGETIVMEAKMPEASSPSEHSLLSNLKFAAYKLHHSSYFFGDTKGKTVADITFGTYTQNVYNKRYVFQENKVFAETISSSALKSLAEQKYAEDGIIIFRPSTSVSGSSASFASSAYQMPYDDYSKNYGTIPNQLSKYIINEETILSIKDENSASGHVSILTDDADDISEPLVPDADGNYKFTLTLDPFTSSLYYRNEVRTLGGADSNPIFHSVTLTITIDENWNPISVRTVENYDIEIPVLGKMNCTGDLTEVFSMIDDDTGEIPEYEFFKPYIEEAKSKPDYAPPIPPTTVTAPSDYLSVAFADYLTGAKTLDIKADIVSGDYSAYDAVISLNLNTADMKAMLGSGLYVSSSDGKVNIKLNDINGYMTADRFEKLTSADQAAALLAGLGNLDVTKLFGGDMLESIFGNCEMTNTDGVVRIHLPFEIDLSSIHSALGKATIDASIYINDSDKSLVSISGSVTIGGKTIDIEVSPIAKLPKFPSTDGATDLSGIVDFITDGISTGSQKIYGVKGNVSVNGIDAIIDAYIDRTSGLKVDATITVNGIDVSVKCVDGTAYVGVGPLDIRGNVSDLPAILGRLTGITGLDAVKYFDKIKPLLPTSLNEAVGMLKSATVDGNKFKLGINVINIIPIELSVARSNGVISNIGATVKFDMFDIKLDMAANFDISAPASREIEIPDNDATYITFGELTDIIENAMPYLQSSDNYSVSLDGIVSFGNAEYAISGNADIDRVITDGKTDIAVSATLNTLGRNIDIVYVDGTAFVTMGAVKFKLATSDISSFKTPIATLISNFVDLNKQIVPPFGAIAGMLKSLDVSNDGALLIELSVPGGDISASLDIKTGKVYISGTVDTVRVDMTATITKTSESRNIRAPQNSADYADIAELRTLLEVADGFINNKCVSATVSFEIAGTHYNAQFAASLDNGLAFRIAEPAIALDVVYVGGKLYVAYGDIRICGTASDAKEISDIAMPILPQNIVDMINATLKMLHTKPTFDISAIAGKALDSITALNIANGNIELAVAYAPAAVELVTATDLSNIKAHITYGDYTFYGTLENVSSAPITIAVPTGDYAEISAVAAASSSIVPLIQNDGLDIAIDVQLYDVKITGKATLCLDDANSIAADVSLLCGDVPVDVSIANGNIYIAVANTVKITERLSEESILGIIKQIDYILPGTYESVVNTLAKIKALSIADIVSAIAMRSAENGFAVSVDLNNNDIDIAVAITASIENGKLSALGLDCDAMGINVDAHMTAVTTDGALTALVGKEITLNGIALDVTLGLSGTDAFAPTPIAGCIAMSEIAEYVPAIVELVSTAKTTKSARLGFGAFVLTSDNKQIPVSGNVSLSLDPFALEIMLTLFDGSVDENGKPASEQVSVIFTGSTIYIKSGNIKVLLDTVNDTQRLYEIVSQYIPTDNYLNIELKKLLCPGEGASAFNTLTLLVERIKTVVAIFDNNAAQSTDKIERVVNLLFSSLEGLRGDSAIKTTLDMARLFKTASPADKLAVEATLFGITLNIVPELKNSKITSAEINTNIGFGGNGKSDIYMQLDINSYSLDTVAITIAAPKDSAEYLSVMDLIVSVNNAINTLTAKDPDGNITFELKTFDYDYDIYNIATTVDENGNTVNLKDSVGRDAPKIGRDGNKVIAQSIKINNAVDSNGNAMSALKFKFVKPESNTTATGSVVSSGYRFNLETHITLDITTYLLDSDGDYLLDGNGNRQTTVDYTYPITVDAYVVNTDGNGKAVIDYKEVNKNGERFYIDYKSVMQIVAAVMDILGIDDNIVEMLLGDYRLDVDTSVFDSMDIAGVDIIKDMFGKFATAMNKGKSAFGDIKSAWNTIYNAGSIDGLRNKLDELKTLMTAVVGNVKSAVAAFIAPKTQDSAQSRGGITIVNGGLYKRIVRAVTLERIDTVDENGVKTSAITAKVNNDIISGKTEIGADTNSAAVTVSESGGTLDFVRVGNLDVNTAKLKNFDTMFVAGGVMNDIALPDNYENGGGLTYSDVSDIKHLLFDIMNTANIKEFEIGGGGNDTIHLNIDLKLFELDVDIPFNAKVKIIDLGQNSVPRYKTAAAVELNIPDYNVAGIQALPKCTTRLYFYDNVLYISGIKSGWKKENTIVANRKKQLWWYTGDEENVLSAEFTDDMYTVDDLIAMINSGRDGVEKLFKDVLFRLVPLTSSASIMGININVHNEIIKAIYNGNGNPELKTIAQIFKGYNYTDGKHLLTIGLKELGQDNNLRDLYITLTGKNDGDDNIYDNYIESANISTMFTDVVSLSLNATLINTKIDYYEDNKFTTPSANNAVTDYGKLASKGLSTTCVADDRVLYTYKGEQYFGNDNNKFQYGNVHTLSAEQRKQLTIDDIVNTLLADVTTDAKGKVISIANRADGIQWTRGYTAA